MGIDINISPTPGNDFSKSKIESKKNMSGERAFVKSYSSPPPFRGPLPRYAFHFFFFSLRHCALEY
jgi:hypothetical protein